MQKTLDPIIVDRAIAALPSELIPILAGYGSACVVAGGFLRAVVAHEPISDVDLWVNDKTTAKFVVEAILSQNVTARVHESKNSFTVLGLSKPVQIIHRWTFKSPEQCIDSFDFTISQAALWFADGEWRTCASAVFEDDVIRRQLTYTCPVREEESCGSLVRLFKFFKRGYGFDHQALASVLARAYGGSYEAQTALSIKLWNDLALAAKRMPKPPVPPDHVHDDLTGAGERLGAGSC